MIKRQVLVVQSLVGLSFCLHRLFSDMYMLVSCRAVQIDHGLKGILEEVLRKANLNRNPRRLGQEEVSVNQE